MNFFAQSKLIPGELVRDMYAGISFGINTIFETLIVWLI